jgi:hypothetical protein
MRYMETSLMLRIRMADLFRNHFRLNDVICRALYGTEVGDDGRYCVAPRADWEWSHGGARTGL